LEILTPPIIPAYLNGDSQHLIKNYLHQLGCSSHPFCRTSFASRTEISRFSRTLLRHFRITISDGTGARSEVTCVLGGGEPLLFAAVKSSISCAALVCSSAVACSRICERPGPCYRRAVFIGDNLAIPGSPRPSPPHRQGAMVACIQQWRQPHPLESIDKHEYCGHTRRSKHFLFRSCVYA
jgi:hypothetical protein